MASKESAPADASHDPQPDPMAKYLVEHEDGSFWPRTEAQLLQDPNLQPSTRVLLIATKRPQNRAQMATSR